MRVVAAIIAWFVLSGCAQKYQIRFADQFEYKSQIELLQSKVLPAIDSTTPDSAITVLWRDNTSYWGFWRIEQSFVEDRTLHFRRGSFSKSDLSIQWNRSIANAWPEDIATYLSIRDSLKHALHNDPPPADLEDLAEWPYVCLIDNAITLTTDPSGWEFTLSNTFIELSSLSIKSPSALLDSAREAGIATNKTDLDWFLVDSSDWFPELLGVRATDYYLTVLQLLEQHSAAVDLANQLDEPE